MLDGTTKTNYETVSAEGQKSAVKNGNVDDFRATRTQSRKLKKQLGGSSFEFGDEKRELTTDYRDGFKYSPDLAVKAKQTLDPKLIQNLRAAHFT